jgi:glycerol-3-phosphate dehydrogenase
MPRWKLLAGLTLYDALALFRNVGRHRRLSALEVAELQPTLRTDGLLGGATYYDASTDDSRLTLAVALDARDRGATLINHARVTQLIVERGRAVGAQICDELTGTTTTVRASVMVNSTGPWSDDVRALEGAVTQKKVQGSKGVHVCVDRSRLGNHDALTLLSPDDGRVMFVLPAGELTIIGTTDTFTDVSPDAIRASEGDIHYLLDAANWFFPAAKLIPGDVIAAWAGIRPLAAAATGGDSVSASREHAITVTPAGVVTITGGKLTTFRVMAAQTVDVALLQLRREAPPSGSEDAPIAWDVSASLDRVVGEARAASGDAALGAHLVASYGCRWHEAWASIRSEPGGAERLAPSTPARMGELRYSCRRELACGVGDLLIRRTRLAYQLQDHGQSIADRVARYVAPTLGWPEENVGAEVARYRTEVDRIFSIDR